MSYVKYREDDIKISNHRMHIRQGGLIRSAKTETHFYECKYCQKLFSDKPELICHIRNAHNIVRPVIIVNDKVVGDHVILQYVNHAKILMYGFDGDIVIGGTVLPFEGTDEIDITRLLTEKLSSNKSCTIISNNFNVSIEMHPLSLDDNSMIKIALNDWQNSASQGAAPKALHLNNFHGSERLFMDGIYNYYLACTAKHHKADRYDAADAVLRQFHDLPALGKCVRKAIAFRRNWIDTLRILSNGDFDEFTTFCEYFDGQMSSFYYEPDNYGRQLYIESSTKIVLDSVILFQKGLYSEAKSKLFELSATDNLNDINLSDQINLLNARIADAEGKHRQAMRFYNMLNTPAFCKQYQRKKVTK